MAKKILNIIQGDRKYLSIVFFILILIVASAIITPYLIDDAKNNWADKLNSEINSIEISIDEQFADKMLSLIEKTESLQSKLKNIFKTGDEAYREIIKVLNRTEFEDYSIGIFAPNGRMIAWNNPVIITQDELFPLNRPLGEIYFYDTDLITYVCKTDTVIIDSDNFYLTISKAIDKKYNLDNRFYKEVSFTRELAEAHNITFDVSYNPFSPRSPDGKKHSFDLLNNEGSKIGLVTFDKPLLDNELNLIKETSSKIQSTLVILIFIFLGFGIRNDFRELNSRLLKTFLLLVFLAAGRVLVFIMDFPSAIISGELVNPSNFSSAFGWGIVKSPMELFVTNLFLIIFSLAIYRYAKSFADENPSSLFNKFLKIVSVPLIIIFLLLIRAAGAAAKSVIFDSTIRYFREPQIIPDLPTLLMHLNILLLFFSVMLALTCILSIVLKAWISSAPLLNKSKIYFILSTVIILLSILFYFIQKDPVLSLLLMILFVTGVLVLFYLISVKKRGSVFNYVYITLVASIFSIALLNYFNTKLERESLKTTAFELNRANENLLHFLVEESIRNASSNEEIRNIFTSKFANFDAAAFRLWSGSSIQRESFNSSIMFFDRNRAELGKFNVGMNDDFNVFNFLKPALTEQAVVDEIKIGRDENTKAFAGILPVYERKILLGFIAVAVSFDLQSIGAINLPDFLESSSSILNKVVDVRQLKIFEFINNNLVQVYGDRYPSREQIKEILSLNLSDNNEGWMTLSFENENYITFILKSFKADTEKITAVLVAEKQFSWNLFNFFKVFIVHSFFILILIGSMILIRVRKITYTFKSKLLIAFLLISIIPVISLAIYNRQAVNSRAQEAINSELKQRLMFLENHFRHQRNKNPDRSLENILVNAANELNISYSVYRGTDEIYNSRDIFNRIGMFDKKLNSNAHYFLNYLRFKEFLTEEKVENYNYEALYRTAVIDGEEYIISVNDAFNKIKVSFATVEIDVVIFGIYSFAVILIIIFSTIFANQIAYPIKRLTKAAESVGQGDLNVKIEHNEKGELRDLMDGFNAMTKELQKNQVELAELERENAWKEMAKQVAHEIKNPLTPMKLALQQLSISYRDKNKNFDDLFKKVSSTVLNQIENLSQIASEFSRFAKMPSINLETVDLVALIKDTTNLYLDENITIEFKYGTDAVEIEGDKSHLRRVFINLVRNAIQAGADKVTIELVNENSLIRILVIDNGSGISEDVQAKLFKQSFTTKHQGMGLGLVITKRFLEGINGSIRLKSSVPGNTIFEIVVPLKITKLNE